MNQPADSARDTMAPAASRLSVSSSAGGSFKLGAHQSKPFPATQPAELGAVFVSKLITPFVLTFLLFWMRTRFASQAGVESILAVNGGGDVLLARCAKHLLLRADLAHIFCANLAASC